MSEATRLFVGNLPSNVEESELREEFAFYGAVQNVEVKRKKGLDDKSEPQIFAFVTLQADIQSINKCINEFSQQEWKGNYLKISVARESFMEKLKREREEAIQKKINQSLPPAESTLPKSIHLNIQNEKHQSRLDAQVYTPDQNVKKMYDFSKEHESSYTETKTEPKFVAIADVELDSSIKYVNNKFKSVHDKKIKINGGIGNLSSDFIKPVKVQQKLTPADEKRIKAMQNMRSAYQEKKSMIKLALADVDKKPNKKIVFDDSEKKVDEKNGAKPKKRKSNDTKLENGSQEKQQKRSNLFDDGPSDDDDNDIRFDVKEQFQGQAGQKLLELQGRYQSDKRFVLDSRFLEDPLEKEREELQEDIIDTPEEDEKNRQIEILQGILGTTVNRPGKLGGMSTEANLKKTPLKTMLRFDPSRPDHDKFMNKQAESADGLPKKSKKERKRERLLESNKKLNNEVTAAPDVSQERYYKVNESLKQSMEEKTPFSLLSLFGNPELEEKEDKPEHQYTTTSLDGKGKKSKNPFDVNEKNPFFYDTSDSEDETHKLNGDIKKPVLENGEVKPIIVSENFFFSENDPRLKEGLEFFLDVKASHKPREELKNVIKKRIQNNMRNDKFHAKKLPRKQIY